MHKPIHGNQKETRQEEQIFGVSLAPKVFISFAQKMYIWNEKKRRVERKEGNGASEGGVLGTFASTFRC